MKRNIVRMAVLLVVALMMNPNSGRAQQKIVLPKEEQSVKPKYDREPVGVVNDFDRLFSIQETKRLETMIKGFTDSNGYEFCVVTLAAEPGVKGNLDSLGTLISNSWGVGSKKYNDGLTIVICAGCREMRITNGLGTAQVLSDLNSKDIVAENFLPAFKRGAYYEGVEAGVRRLMGELRGKRPPAMF